MSETTGPAVLDSANDTAPEGMRVAPNGGLLKSGNPGNKGGKGRTPNEFKERMRELLELGDPGDEYLLKCLRGEFGPKYHVASRAHVSDRAYGKAAQPITGEDGGTLQADVTLRLVRSPKADGDG